MNKEFLQKRLVELSQKKARALAESNFIAGQEMEVRHWLSQFEKNEKQESSDVEPISEQILK